VTALHQTTPLVEHAALSAALDKRVFLKLENLQASGSFKLRGIGKLCQNAHARGARRLVCPSGGNAGFAAAVAGPDIWDGNATLIDEAARQIEGGAFDAVVCAVGGGGLMAGVLHGLHRNGLQHVPVIAAETEGAASFAAAIDAGEPVTLPAITSIAGSLGAKRVADEAYAWTRRHEIKSAVVSDADAVDACLRFADDMRLLVEPACGAALAVAYGKLPQLAPFKRPLIVVCGGIGVDLGKLAAWKTQYSL